MIFPYRSRNFFPDIIMIIVFYTALGFEKSLVLHSKSIFTLTRNVLLCYSEINVKYVFNFKKVMLALM